MKAPVVVSVSVETAQKSTSSVLMQQQQERQQQFLFAASMCSLSQFLSAVISFSSTLSCGAAVTPIFVCDTEIELQQGFISKEVWMSIACLHCSEDTKSFHGRDRAAQIGKE
ncbi:MAG: hypothetical protein O3B44_06815 [Bacteroidetes bacterium]|nr:hypothetical protein [Bacteroidota bacterium]